MHLGGGVWLHPIDARPVLTLASGAPGTIAFDVAARCLIPAQGTSDGTRTVDVTGTLALRGASGTWSMESLAVGGAITDANLTLPGGITLDSAAVSLALYVACTFAPGNLVIEITGGTLRLPDSFTTGTAPPVAAVRPDAPLHLVVNAGGVATSGAFDVANFGAALGETGLTATLRFDGLSLPEVTNAAGSITIPLPDHDPLTVVFQDVAFAINGLPTGTLQLGEYLEISLGADFAFTIKAGGGLTLTRSSWILDAAMALAVPASMITDVDGDEIILPAAGRMSLPTTASAPAFVIDTLGAEGSFHLGGVDGILVSGGEIVVLNIENMLAPSEESPFIISLSGEIALPDGPRGGLQNARFIFAGDPLPAFDLDGISVGTGEMALADGLLPVTIERLLVQFEPGLSLPAKLYPENITLTTDATLSLAGALEGSVQDLTIRFDDRGVPSTDLDAFQLEIPGWDVGTMTIGGGVYLGGLQDIPDGLVMVGKLTGKLNGTGITALAAFGVVDGVMAPLGAALAVNLGAVGVPLGPSGFLLTGVAGGISYTGPLRGPPPIPMTCVPISMSTSPER